MALFISDRKNRFCISSDIFSEREYRKKNFIDLFCGGLSVTNYALLHTNFNVFANDLNIYLMSLYEAILMKNPELEIAKYEWVSREKFQDVYEHPEKYPHWYVGYVLQVWSFGCNQKDYLYAREIEEGKHALHEAIVNNDFSLIRQNKNFDGFTVPAHIADIDYRKTQQNGKHFYAFFATLPNRKQGCKKISFAFASNGILTTNRALGCGFAYFARNFASNAF